MTDRLGWFQTSNSRNQKAATLVSTRSPLPLRISASVTCHDPLSSALSHPRLSDVPGAPLPTASVVRFMRRLMVEQVNQDNILAPLGGW